MLKSEGHAVLALPFAGPGKLVLPLDGHVSKIAGPDPHRRAGPRTRTGRRCLQADPDGMGMGELASPLA